VQVLVLHWSLLLAADHSSVNEERFYVRLKEENIIKKREHVKPQQWSVNQKVTKETKSLQVLHSISCYPSHNPILQKLTVLCQVLYTKKSGNNMKFNNNCYQKTKNLKY